ncbi:hypothetical protein [Brasilonema sp. UFV-L1]|uniref:hypothetical protein n=1 Tax=Brasilonema sp. UFV-L1 TaxID=2234130 RepID=UPI0030D7AC02
MNISYLRGKFSSNQVINPFGHSTSHSLHFNLYFLPPARDKSLPPDFDFASSKALPVAFASWEKVQLHELKGLLIKLLQVVAACLISSPGNV